MTMKRDYFPDRPWELRGPFGESITFGQALRYLGVSAPTLSRMVDTGEVRSMRKEPRRPGSPVNPELFLSSLDVEEVAMRRKRPSAFVDPEVRVVHQQPKPARPARQAGIFTGERRQTTMQRQVISVGKVGVKSGEQVPVGGLTLEPSLRRAMAANAARFAAAREQRRAAEAEPATRKRNGGRGRGA